MRDPYPITPIEGPDLVEPRIISALEKAKRDSDSQRERAAQRGTAAIKIQAVGKGPIARQQEEELKKETPEARTQVMQGGLEVRPHAQERAVLCDARNFKLGDNFRMGIDPGVVFPLDRADSENPALWNPADPPIVVGLRMDFEPGMVFPLDGAAHNTAARRGVIESNDAETISLIKKAKSEIKFLESVPEDSRELVGNFETKLEMKKAELRQLDARYRPWLPVQDPSANSIVTPCSTDPKSPKSPTATFPHMSQKTWVEAGKFADEVKILIDANCKLANRLASWHTRHEKFMRNAVVTIPIDSSENGHGISWGTPHGKKAPSVSVEASVEASFQSSSVDNKWSTRKTTHTTNTAISNYSSKDSRDGNETEPTQNGEQKSGLGRQETALELGAKEARRRARMLLDGFWLGSLIGLIIFANSVFIGMEVEYIINNREYVTPAYLRVSSHAFNLFFLLEFLLRCCATCGTDFFARETLWWNLLDALIVGFSVVEIVFDVGASLDSSTNLRIIRILRVARMARVLRLSRVLRLFKALKELVYSIACTLQSLFWAMVLLVIIIYAFGIVFTQSAADYIIQAEEDLSKLSDGGNALDAVHKYWGSLFISMRTLFESIAGGVSWIDPLQALDRTQSPVMATICFGFFISFTYFAVLNVVTAVFCSNAMESAARDNETMIANMMQNRERYCGHIRNLFKSIDQDSSGNITLAEFENRFKDKEVQAYLASLDLNAHDAMQFFKLLDADEGGEISIEEFMDGCLRMRGPARSVDVLRMMHEQRKIARLVARIVEPDKRQRFSAF